ncbi:hypothetical protein VT84_09120 [Gemmata sp. SH-PL17]|uniref:hypothetical protein n=1 Tax=Gemmata sp. SH-PL17 TaxID=1630693 RepID=UPI00078D7841|nr:hypothetical protein [Gemmata sp. SH-PL17]AMV24543.1 hypothetical protein VT84_09120 [Gemmata sp. SH-PL17]
MPRPRVRYDDKGEPLPCKLFVPPHLAKFLYRQAAKARKGDGLKVEETDIVIELIEKWAAGQPPVDWPALLTELQAEESKDSGTNVRGSGKKIKKGPPKEG